MQEPIRHTTRPMTTGTSVLGLAYDGGVYMAADTLGSYGSLARFRNVTRFHRVGRRTVVGAGGDYADFQYLTTELDAMAIEDECQDDGHSLGPSEVFHSVTRRMYNARSDMNPLWNSVVVAGAGEDNTPFLGYIDLIGVTYQDRSIATGYGAYIARPLLRKAIDDNPAMNAEEAKKVIEDCMRVLWYRDARSLNRIELVHITADGTVTVSEPYELESNWEIAHHVHGYN